MFLIMASMLSSMSLITLAAEPVKKPEATSIQPMSTVFYGYSLIIPFAVFQQYSGRVHIRVSYLNGNGNISIYGDTYTTQIVTIPIQYQIVYTTDFSQG
jgi:hypothetical protein